MNVQELRIGNYVKVSLINKVRVKGIHPTVWNIFLIRDYSTYSYKTFYDFGTTLFLTYEEAKEKLKEVK